MMIMPKLEWMESVVRKAMELSPEENVDDQVFDKVEKFMNSCTDEEVSALETIMYIGREDWGYKNINPKALYTKRFLELAGDPKNIAIEQMISKMPLRRYFQQGIEVLY